jgi:predicted nucleic acid-binding protein
LTKAFVAEASRGNCLGASGSSDGRDCLDAGRYAAGATLEIPSLWPLEVANALTVLVRRGKLTDDERETALGWLSGLRTRIDHEGPGFAFSKLSELADLYKLSVYDATYLELVQRRGLAFGCKDGPLRQAAKQSGVQLWSGAV